MSNLPHPFALSLLFSFLPFFFPSIATQSDNSTDYPSCPSYDCGEITISYPFWKIGDQTATQFCGYQGFGINCSTIDGNRQIPSINLGKDSYYVWSITYNYSAIILVDFDVSPVVIVPNRCPRVRHNISLETLPLNFSGLNVNLSFHFNCTGSPGFATLIPCLKSGERNSYFNTLTSETENSDWNAYSCEGEVVTTVLQYMIDRLVDLTTQFSQALSSGFELRWGKTDECEKCEDSDGRCGHNINTGGFMCFCSGGTSTTDDCKGPSLDWERKVGISVGSAVFGVLIMCAALYFWRRRRNMKKRYYGSSYTSRNISSYTSSMTDPEKNGVYHGVQIFKYRELEKATNYFDPTNELGDGGFGTVYKGKLRDGRVVAVKRLYENNYRRVEQFMNEIGILAVLRHRNLVSLYGCTTHHSRELLLVYEYIPNGTVADHLHGDKSSPGSLKWPTRMSIATETASALVYLHASEVVHRDVKTNNILLDDSFSVKVADFGLSRLFPNNVTHVSTAPQGTPGYVDPEYHECYQLTNKSDVYSFGVVLIELISSKPAVDITRHRHEINLSNMAINKIRNDAVHELVDPSLGFENDYEVRKMINGVAELAFQCLQNERDCRPSMDEVLERLVSIQNGKYNQAKQDVVEGTSDVAVLLKNPSRSQTMSPDSVAIGWSTSTMSTSSG